MVDLEAKKGRLSFKDALLSKYSFDDEDENLCFIHFTGSPKHKGTFKYVNLKFHVFLASGCIDTNMCVQSLFRGIFS